MNPGTDKNEETSVKARVEAFATQCREVGLRVTPQRMAVYEALLKTDEHPSAENVYRRVREVFPSISLDTVNRTLLTLSEMGTAFIVEGSGEAKRFDANLEDHQHFKCVRCRRIIDINHEPFDLTALPKSLPEGFKVLRATVYVEGLCNQCLQNSQ